GVFPRDHFLHDFLMPGPKAVNLRQPMFEHQRRILGRPGETMNVFVPPAFAVIQVFGFDLQPAAFRKTTRKNSLDLHQKIEGLIRVGSQSQQISEQAERSVESQSGHRASPSEKQRNLPRLPCYDERRAEKTSQPRQVALLSLV